MDKLSLVNATRHPQHPTTAMSLLLPPSMAVICSAVSVWSMMPHTNTPYCGSFGKQMTHISSAGYGWLRMTFVLNHLLLTRAMCGCGFRWNLESSEFNKV